MIVNGVDTRDITVVVQGAVTEKTKDCLYSVRKFLPESVLVLSTWENTNIKGLTYDVLVQSKDPGAFPCDTIQNSVMNNINRQIISTYNGLLQSNSIYCIKMRSDFYFKGNNFLEFWEKFNEYDTEYHFFKNRLIACTVYSRNPRSNIQPLVMPYCPSDFFFFGLREDLISLFDRNIITDINEKMFFELYPEKQKYLKYKDALCQYMPEQSIWMGFLQKHIDDLDCECRDHITEKNIVLTERSFANNLILCSAEQLGIDTYKDNLFDKGIPENCYTHQDWKDLYSFYCLGDGESLNKLIDRTEKNSKDYNISIQRKTNNKLEVYKTITDLRYAVPLVSKYEYVSFDIFDTLIFRKSAPDWQALAQTSEYICMLLSAKGINALVPEIDYLRNVYVDYYGKKNISMGGSQEYKIRDVIFSILQHFGISQGEARSLSEQISCNELCRDKCSFILNEEVRPTLIELLYRKKKLIAISDMYYSQEDVMSALESVGILKYFYKVFVSSELNSTKADGKIYKRVAKELNTEVGNIIHIGDNFTSDVVNSSKSGFSAVFYNNQKNVDRKKSLEEETLGINNKPYIGSAMRVIENPVTFCEYLHSYFSFDIINFVYDLMRKVYKEKISHVFFMERDGTLFGEICQKLLDGLLIFKGLPRVRLQNLKLSRKDTACLIRIEYIEDVVGRAYRINPPKRFHILHILGCYGISLCDLDEEIRTDIVNHNSDPAYFEKIYYPYIYPVLEKRKKYVETYLHDNGFFKQSKVAIVDIGWGGTSQRDITSYLDQNYNEHTCYGFYYACDDRARALAPFYSQYHYAPDLFYGFSLLEFIVKAYSKTEIELRKNIEKNPDIEETLRLNYLARVQILSDVTQFIQAVNEFQLTPELIRQYTFPRLKWIINDPPVDFLQELQNVRFSLDRRKGDIYIPLFEKIKSSDELQDQYDNAMWAQASMKISGITLTSKRHSIRSYYHSVVDNDRSPKIIRQLLKSISNLLKRIGIIK